MAALSVTHSANLIGTSNTLLFPSMYIPLSYEVLELPLCSAVLSVPRCWLLLCCSAPLGFLCCCCCVWFSCFRLCPCVAFVLRFLSSLSLSSPLFLFIFWLSVVLFALFFLFCCLLAALGGWLGWRRACTLHTFRFGHCACHMLHRQFMVRS